MSLLDTLGQAASAIFTVIKAWLPLGLAITLGAFAVFMLQSYERELSDVDNIALEWNETIKKLGIEPVYPPQEDLSVGDVFAVVTSDDLERTAARTFPSRSLKLTHLDLSASLAEAYKKVYRFPISSIRGEGSDSWAQTQTGPAEPLFEGRELRSLPLVMFPGLSSVRTQNIAGGHSNGEGIITRLFGFSGRTDSGYDVKLGGTEAYGLPSIEATKAITEFCLSDATRAFCKEMFVRKQLGLFLYGDQIFERKAKAPEEYRFGVQIWLISRVYLARQIEVTKRDAVASRLEVVPASETPSQEAAPKGASPPAASADLSSEVEKLRQEIAEIKAQSFARDGASGRKIHASGISERPLVIGFVAVRALTF